MSYINTGFIVARQPQTHKFCTRSDFRCQPHREVDASLPLTLYEIESRVSMGKDGTQKVYSVFTKKRCRCGYDRISEVRNTHSQLS